MKEETIRNAVNGRKKSRDGLALICKGKGEVSVAVAIGLISESDDTMTEAVNMLEAAVNSLKRERSIVNLMRIAEIAGAATEIETMKKLFMVGPDYSYKFERKRHGIDMIKDGKVMTSLAYDEITDEDTGHAMTRDYRRSVI